MTALPDDSSLVRLALRVRDLDRLVAYYTEVLGAEVVERGGSKVSLACGARLFHIDLHHAPDAALRPYPCPGLYHFALVVPDRAALGAVFRRLIERSEPFEGMADHLVSEALYIRDPEQNGIELYRDRPKSEWTFLEGGGVKMASEPLDAEGIIAEAETSAPLDAETRLGHIHLHVSDLAEASSYFEGVLGLNRMAEMSGALFFAAGDYHHHVGANTWAPATLVPDDATGLVAYTWRVTDGVVRDAETDPVGALVRFDG